MTPLLEVKNLVTRFYTEQGTVFAVNGISYRLTAGESLAIVGESGCGKSVSAQSMLGLIPDPPGRIESGEAIYKGVDLLKMPASELRRVRGSEIAMIFQDPMTSLNPVLAIGYQLDEALRNHCRLNKGEAKRQVEEMLQLVGIPNAGARLNDYPHQFSGGQRQRIMIAMALICKPAILIADEPTTALDVTVQAQIVDLVKTLQSQLNMSIIWITHDLALVAGLVDVVLVMYAGYIVEAATVKDLFLSPLHPYTKGLLGSIPRTDVPQQERLASIEGMPPDLRTEFKTCPFAQRCPQAFDRCFASVPPLKTLDSSHSVACFLPDNVQQLIDIGAET